MSASVIPLVTVRCTTISIACSCCCMSWTPLSQVCERSRRPVSWRKYVTNWATRKLRWDRYPKPVGCSLQTISSQSLRPCLLKSTMLPRTRDWAAFSKRSPPWMAHLLTPCRRWLPHPFWSKQRAHRWCDGDYTHTLRSITCCPYESTWHLTAVENTTSGPCSNECSKKIACTWWTVAMPSSRSSIQSSRHRVAMFADYVTTRFTRRLKNLS